MSSIAEIKHHIKAVDDTAKITRAMHLIASGKMKKAVRAHEQTMLFYNRVRSNMRFILDNSPEGFKSVFYRDHGKRCAFLVIAGDKGMCGGYNQEVLKLAFQKVVTSTTHQRTRLLTFGHMATNFFKQKGIPVDESYLSAVQKPSLDIARELSAQLCAQYEKQLFDEVFIIFTQLLKGGITRPTCLHVLPLNRSAVVDVEPMHTPLVGLTFEPSLAETLDSMARHYVSGVLYSALVQSYASENRSRMTAMESATRNADEMLKKLKLELNHARQSEITQEINEIIGGNPESFTL
ncbi:MAG: ATP synthase F1 subunit gamma [Candidatus Limiplasma sp.]|nr:ATP synthase F1 subunit gamma [Candidatus Limiplasma sp.]